MWTRTVRLLAPPVFEDDEDKTSAASLLNTLLMILLTGVVLFAGSVAVVGETISSLVSVIMVVLSVVAMGLLVFLRFGYVRPVGVTLSFVLWVSFTLPMFSLGGIHDSAITGYFLVIVMAGIVAGGRTLFLISLLSVLATVGAFWAENSALIAPSIETPSALNDLVLVVLMLGTSALLLRYALRRIAGAYERARANARALGESNRELQASRDLLEAQTRELGRRARYLETTAAVARDAASILGDVQDVLSRVADLIGEQFGFYHVGLFLVDAAGEWAELRAVSSEGGRRMLARGHRLRMGEQGIVGYVADRGEHRIALDVGRDAHFFDNPDLPETRSEVALPLRARGEIIGVLDVQSRQAEAFTVDDVRVLQTLADQVAVAIDNAQLFQQAKEALEAERRAYGEVTREAWRALLRVHPDLGFLSDDRGTVPAGNLWDSEMVTAVQTGETVPGDGGGNALAVPIKARGHVVGVIDAHLPEGARAWTLEQISLLETLADQLGVALESAQLYLESQRRAARERAIGEIADKMRSAIDMDALLQTAIQETAAILDASRAFVQWVPSPESIAAHADVQTERQE